MRIINVARKVMETAVTKETCAFGGEKNHKGVDLVPKSTDETPAILAYDRGVVIATGNINGINHSNGTAGSHRPIGEVHCKLYGKAVVI